MVYSCFGKNAGIYIACVDRWTRAGGCGLLVGFVHLVDLGHVDPVDDVVVDVLDDDVDSLRLAAPWNLNRHLLDVSTRLFGVSSAARYHGNAPVTSDS